MFISINFIDLNESLKKYILKSMLISFNKLIPPYFLNNNILIDIYNRFTKKSCIVNLYYINNILHGVCISWLINSSNKYIYLDKFFSLKQKNGIGKEMLNLFIEKYTNNNINNNINNKSIIKNKLLWRTDISTSLFYNKNNKVIIHFKNEKYNKIYMGVNRIIWEYEDIYDIKIKSCFFI